MRQLAGSVNGVKEAILARVEVVAACFFLGSNLSDIAKKARRSGSIARGRSVAGSGIGVVTTEDL